MRAALVLYGIPDPGFSGDGITEKGLIQALSSLENLELDFVILPETGGSLTRISHDSSVFPADATVVHVSPLEKIPRFALRLSKVLGVGSFLGSFALRRSAARVLEKTRYDLVFAYHWNATFATRGVPNRVCLLGDPLTAPLTVRALLDAQTKTQIRRKLSHYLWRLRVIALRMLMRAALRNCLRVFTFSAFHAVEIGRLIGRSVLSLPTPLPDLSKSRTPFQQRKRRGSEVFTILLMGQLSGTATRQGLQYFRDNLLEIFSPMISSGKVKIKIAGGPIEAALSTSWKSISDAGCQFIGHVFPPEIEYEKADALLVPTSVPLGNRVRILDAWKHGLPVIAHIANQAGMPELTHSENAFLAESALEFRAGVLRLMEEPEFARKLSSGGFETVRRNNCPAKVGKILTGELS